MTEVVGGSPVPPAGEFVSIGDVEDFLGVEADDKLTFIVAGVNVAIAKFVKRQLLSRQVTEYLDGCGFLNDLYLREYPVTEVSEVKVKSGFGEWETWHGDYYRLDVNDESEVNAGLVCSECGPWPQGHKNICVTYKAGYTVVPDDLKLAALQYCQELYRDAKNGKKIQSERLGDYSYSLMTNDSVESLLDARRVLGRYRRVSI